MAMPAALRLGPHDGQAELERGDAAPGAQEVARLAALELRAGRASGR